MARMIEVRASYSDAQLATVVERVRACGEPVSTITGKRSPDRVEVAVDDKITPEGEAKIRGAIVEILTAPKPDPCVEVAEKLAGVTRRLDDTIRRIEKLERDTATLAAAIKVRLP